MRLNLNNFTLVKNALLARRLFGSAIINENSKSLVSSSSSSSSLNLSAFCVNPASRQYSSYPILNRNRNSNSKFLLVVGKNSSNRTMSTTQVNFKLERAFDNIVKSSQDKREYRGLLLDNGLKCLLISDPTTDRSAAAVDVHAGYLLDPKEFPGLAHFCEHMLFMGSKKYPQENLFMKFIEDHAGHTNAYTSSENTNYHFEVSTGKFKEALDIFAQFFISPLFDASSTDREINAVDSENQKNLKSDAWRLDQLEKAQAREDHPYSKFGTGNLDTLKTEPEKLGLSVREELLRFHTKYYSSNLMSLVLLGKESLEELQQYAVEMFSDIPNKNLPKVDFDPNPYSEDALATIKYINPVQDIRQLSIAWTVPDLRDKYASGPAQYLTHLVGHEGEGSLLSELKRRGWCNNLYAGSRREVRGFQFFNLTVDLSEEGGENLNGVIKCVYEYINMVKRNGPSKWVFDEYAKLGKLSFDFKDKETPINYVASLASDLHVLEIPDVLSAHYYPTKYEPDEIVALFPYLEPKKMRVSAISKKYEGKTDRTEKWYGTEYKLERLDEQLVKELSSSDLSNDRLRLPAPNDFIPVDLDLIKHDTDSLPKHPRIVYSNGLTRLWYKEDNKFLLPKAAIRLELRNPLVYFSPVNVNMTAIFVDLLLDSLTEYLYPAEMADLRYRIIATSYGLNVNVHGFNDKIDRLLKTIFERMVNFTVDPERFKILKERYTRNLMNFEADQPYKHSVYYLTLLISEKGWEKKQLMETVNDFSIEDLQHFIHQTLSNGVFIDSIVFGNLSHQKAIEIVKSVEETLSNGTRKVKPLEAIYLKNFRQFHLPDGESHVFTKNNVVHKTAGIEVYYQCGQQTTHDNALVELFCQVINESSFNVLRTQEQLGYIVASGVRNFGGVNGVRLIIQSDRPPLYLDERIENFLKMTQETIEAMTDEEFKTHVEALALTKLEEPKKMTKQCEIYWNEIISHQYHFDRENDEVEELRKLTKANLIQFFYEFISAESNKRRKLAVYIYPPEMNAEHTKENLKATLIEDRNEWQNGLPLYSLPKPHIKIN